MSSDAIIIFILPENAKKRLLEGETMKTCSKMLLRYEIIPRFLVYKYYCIIFDVIN